MEKQYHILNGDALKEQFPKEIEGEIIVIRECLVDGNVNGKDLEDLFQTRARFISEFYGDSHEGYYMKVVQELERMKSIPENSHVNLWFEDDLFCQVNFWFTIHFLITFRGETNVFLVRPPSHDQYGFAGLNNSRLIRIYKNKIKLSDLKLIASLWKAYQNSDTQIMISIAEKLEDRYPFILTAVMAHIERIPSKNNPGRPARSLLQIVHELKTEEFGPVFKEFTRRESLYGFGDMQVKRLFDEVIRNR